MTGRILISALVAVFVLTGLLPSVVWCQRAASPPHILPDPAKWDADPDDVGDRAASGEWVTPGTVENRLDVSTPAANLTGSDLRYHQSIDNLVRVSLVLFNLLGPARP